MAFITIGGTLVEVQHASASQNASTDIGESARSFSGMFRTGVRAQKRAWQFTLIPMSESVWEALLAGFGIYTPLVCTGDFVNGANVTCVVQIGNVGFIPSGSSFVRDAAITLLEV
ncbi:MAG: hypothetical protein ABI119_11055 [Gemmatimonadaceae bacterium]